MDEIATSSQLPDRETFYQLLTAHHAGLVEAGEQQQIRDSVVLIAGCEAVGTCAAEHLARAGVERFILSDDRIVTLHQLARLSGGPDTLGQGCAEVLGANLARINPHADISTHSRILGPEELAPLVSSVDLIVDALGFEHVDEFRTRWFLHRAGQANRVPVVSGFDIEARPAALVHNYQDEQQEILGGAYALSDLESAQSETAIPVLLSMMSLSKSQPEVLRETERILLGQRDNLPRSAPASGLAGSIVAQTAIDLLLDRPVRKVVAVDLEEAVQPPGGLRKTGRKLAALYSLRRHLRHRRREGRVGVFSPLEDEVFQGLRPYMEERIYEAGSVIVRQGDNADEFFVVTEGQVHVEYEERDDDDETLDHTIIAELGPGDYFGRWRC
ncbi:MAG: ThiF family adenylyltransferase [Thermomicrobiales bacterium]